MRLISHHLDRSVRLLLRTGRLWIRERYSAPVLEGSKEGRREGRVGFAWGKEGGMVRVGENGWVKR